MVVDTGGGSGKALFSSLHSTKCTLATRYSVPAQPDLARHVVHSSVPSW